MDRESKDRFNFLAAFVAAVVGLVAFREELSGVTFKAFGATQSAYDVLVVMGITLLLAVYIGAFARIVVAKFNTAPLPLAGWASKAGDMTATVGLVVPLLYAFAWLLTTIFDRFMANFMLEMPALDVIAGIVGSVLSGLLAILAAIFGLRVNKQNDRAKLESALAEMKYVSTQIKTTGAKAAQGASIVSSYEIVVHALTAYLEARGYGVRPTANLVELVRILVGIGGAEQAHIGYARKVTDVRNRYLHGESLTQDQLSEANRSLNRIIVKINASGIL